MSSLRRFWRRVTAATLALVLPAHRRLPLADRPGTRRVSTSAFRRIVLRSGERGASRRHRARFLAVTCCAILLSCGGGSGTSGDGGSGGSGVPPALSNLTYSPHSATVNDGGGSVVVTGSVDFADADADVTGLAITTFDATGVQVATLDIPVQNPPGVTSGTLSAEFSISTTIVGTYTFRIQASDTRGHVSNFLDGSFFVSDRIVSVLATAPAPSHLVLQNGLLYWSDASSSPVKSIPIDGGMAAPLAIHFTVPLDLAFSGQDFIWAEPEAGFAPSGCVATAGAFKTLRASLGGSIVQLEVGDSCSPISETSDLVLDGANVYWVTSTASPDVYRIESVPLSGGAGSIVVSSDWSEIASLKRDASYLYWEELLSVNFGAIKRMPLASGPVETLYASPAGTYVPTGGIAVEGPAVFFAENGYPSSERISSVPIAGGMPMVLAELQLAPALIVRPLVADGASVYWRADDGTVRAVPVSGGAVTTLASGVKPLTAIALDGVGNLVWAEGDAIRRVPILGGAVDTIASGVRGSTFLTVDASGLYWGEGDAVEGFGRVARLVPGGTGPATFLSGISSSSPPIAVAGDQWFAADLWQIKVHSASDPLTVVEWLASSSFYITDLATDGVAVYWDDGAFGDIWKVPVAGGPAELLSNGLENGGGAQPGPIRVSDGFVYWLAGDTIKRVPVGGGPVTMVVSGVVVADLAVRGSTVYFSDYSGDKWTIKEIPGEGGTATTVTSFAYSLPRYLALDDQNVYWLAPLAIGAQGESGVWRVPVGGGAKTRIADVTSALYHPESIAVDGTSVYWTDTAEGAVKKATPK